MRNVVLQLAYDGTGFVGSQWQRNGRSVQGEVEAAWAKFTQEKCRFTLAGRTDAGVHAQGQIANVHTATQHSLATITRAMNAILPRDVSVVDTWDVPDTFHARFSAVRREYRYLIDTAATASPLLRHHVVHVAHQLDRALMEQALTLLLGEHDFAAFAGVDPDNRSTIRRCFHAAIQTTAFLGRDLIAVDLVANAFLRHMVRTVVGTVLLVGQRRLDVSGFARVLQSADRKQAGPTAPAHGLYLMSVAYPGLDSLA